MCWIRYVSLELNGQIHAEVQPHVTGTGCSFEKRYRMVSSFNNLMLTSSSVKTCSNHQNSHVSKYPIEMERLVIIQL